MTPAGTATVYQMLEKIDQLTEDNQRLQNDFWEAWGVVRCVQMWLEGEPDMDAKSIYQVVCNWMEITEQQGCKPHDFTELETRLLQEANNGA